MVHILLDSISHQTSGISLRNSIEAWVLQETPRVHAPQPQRRRIWRCMKSMSRWWWCAASSGTFSAFGGVIDGFAACRIQADITSIQWVSTYSNLPFMVWETAKSTIYSHFTVSAGATAPASISDFNTFWSSWDEFNVHTIIFGLKPPSCVWMLPLVCDWVMFPKIIGIYSDDIFWYILILH